MSPMEMKGQKEEMDLRFWKHAPQTVAPMSVTSGQGDIVL